MAQMFPNTLIGSVPPATMRVFTRLKRLPDEHFHVWQRLAVWSEAGPDFWLLRGDGRSLLLKVASVTRREVQQWQQPAIQETLFAPRAEVSPPGAAEQAALRHFQQGHRGYLSW